jgi:hypothetical protein
VKVTVLVVVVLVGLNAAVTPLGNPVAARFTLPLKPFWPLTLMVLLALLPGEALRLAAEVARLKLGATTDSPIDVVLLRLPEVPLMVSG